MMKNLLVVVLFVSLSFGTTFYVSTMGSEGNNCTLSFPCLTIQDALDAAQDQGATFTGVSVEEGVYQINAPLNFTGMPGSISGDGDVTLMYQDTVTNYSPFSIDSDFGLYNLNIMPLDSDSGFSGNLFYIPSTSHSNFLITIEEVSINEFVRLASLDETVSLDITNSQFKTNNFSCHDSYILARDTEINFTSVNVYTPCAFVESYETSATYIDCNFNFVEEPEDEDDEDYPNFVISQVHGTHKMNNTNFMNYKTIGGALFLNNVDDFMILNSMFDSLSLVPSTISFNPKSKAPGLVCEDSYGTIDSCTFRNNTNTIDGAVGGSSYFYYNDTDDVSILPPGSMMQIMGSTFDQNRADTGSAFAASNFLLPFQVTDTVFTDNIATSQGTIFVLNTCNYQFTECTFDGNSASTGSVISCDSCFQGSDINFTDTTYMDNTNTNPDGSDDTCGTLPPSVVLSTSSDISVNSYESTDDFPTWYVVGPILGAIVLAAILSMIAGIGYTIYSKKQERNEYETI